VPPHRGELKAVNYSLPWPGLGPLVVVPQASASRQAGAGVRIVNSSVEGVALDGSSLTLTSPLTTWYTLAAGEESARGWIAFTGLGTTVGIEHRACRDQTSAIFDVSQASLKGSPLRIVAYTATTGSVTVDGDGGTAHFRGPVGTHRVTLLTANDAGTAGPAVTATVTVG